MVSGWPVYFATNDSSAQEHKPPPVRKVAKPSCILHRKDSIEGGDMQPNWSLFNIFPARRRFRFRKGVSPTKGYWVENGSVSILRRRWPFPCLRIRPGSDPPVEGWPRGHGARGARRAGPDPPVLRRPLAAAGARGQGGGHSPVFPHNFFYGFLSLRDYICIYLYFTQAYFLYLICSDSKRFMSHSTYDF